MGGLRVAFDHEIFTRQKMGGISRYFFHLVSELNTLGVESTLYAPLHGNDVLRRLPARQVKGLDMGPGFYTYKGGFIYLNMLFNKLQAIGSRADVVHETYYSKFANLGSKRPVVVTVHDFVHEKYPELFPSSDNTRELKKKAIARAQHIICISEHTKQDLLKYYPIGEEKVSVIYHGSTPLPISHCQNEVASKPYFLYVGGRMPYKNFGLVLKALASSAQLHQNFELIAFGGGPFTNEELHLIQTLGLQHVVKHKQGNDEALQRAYANAEALIYPSLYEGFGLPPLEAMHARCPVLLSNASCLPEISGAAGLYFDPLKTDSLATAMLQIIDDHDLKIKLIEKGELQAARYNWAETTKKTFDLYLKIR